MERGTEDKEGPQRIQWGPLINVELWSSPHVEVDEALQAQAWLQSLEKPNQHTPDNLRLALRLDSDVQTSISEIDADYLNPKNSLDLIKILPYPNKEVFSRFLVDRFGVYFLSSSEKGKIIGVFSDHHIRRITRVVAVVLSSILPILSIVILYLVHSTNIHIGLIVIFSSVFSGVVALVSDARNVEIIAATAAYAAVLVVFVSGNLQSP